MHDSKNSEQGNGSSRRRFLTTATAATAAVAAGGWLSRKPVARPPVHASGSDLLRVGLIGCGGRGSCLPAAPMQPARLAARFEQTFAGFQLIEQLAPAPRLGDKSIGP